MTSHTGRPLRAAALAALTLALAPAPAATADEFRLEAVTLPRPLLDGAATNLEIEASGVEPIGDGTRFLVAHDKTAPLYVVDLATGRISGAPLTSAKFPAPTPTGPKWEGMTRDSAGNYYVIGAHNGKTDAERATKSVLLRFRLKDADGDRPAIDDASVVRLDIARSFPAVLKSIGLDDARLAKRKIEGLAVREAKGANGATRTRELYIGLREPGDRVRSFKADLSADPSPDAELELKPGFSFEAEPREGVSSNLTSMEYVAALGGFLVVTATEDTGNAFHGNTLWFVADGTDGAARKVAVFEVAMKCEGLAVLGVEGDARRTAVKLLITFDNDPHATKIPSRFQTATLVRDAR